MMLDSKTAKNSRKLYLESYGCAMNFSDSEVVASILGENGFETTRNIDEADLILLNTCFLYFKEDVYVSLQVHIKVGEYEVIDNKKYKIVALEFSTNRKLSIDKNLEEKAKIANYNIFVYQNKIVLELPIILW